jgi:hypothetical protein
MIMVVGFFGCDASYIRSCIMTQNLATITDKPRKLPLHCPTTVHVSGEMLEQGLVSLFCATDAIDSLMKHTDPFSENLI